MKYFIKVEMLNLMFNLFLKYLSFKILNLKHCLFRAKGFLFFQTANLFLDDDFIEENIN
jgi:hypothetical protein